MSDKNAILDLALQRCKLVNENLDKNPLQTAQNVVKFLNLTYEEMQEMAIRDRLAIILWDRKFNNKHNFSQSCTRESKSYTSGGQGFQENDSRTVRWRTSSILGW